jgi:hypothetical protein
LDDYNVEITSEGRSGDVIYSEQGNSLSFWWEFSTTGAFISIPSGENWNAFCERENALWAKDRKSEIVSRMAAETRRQKAGSAEIEIEDEWINLKF